MGLAGGAAADVSLPPPTPPPPTPLEEVEDSGDCVTRNLASVLSYPGIVRVCTLHMQAFNRLGRLVETCTFVNLCQGMTNLFLILDRKQLYGDTYLMRDIFFWK